MMNIQLLKNWKITKNNFKMKIVVALWYTWDKIIRI